MQLTVGMVLFEGFELLDAFGPLEMFGLLKDKVKIVIIGENTGLVKSSAGPAVFIENTFADDLRTDVLMVPGGIGTRQLVNSQEFIDDFKNLAIASTHVASICTGAAVLARTGLLDGRKATTNKKSFQWVTTQGINVDWVKHARWIEDGKFFTSAGVSAGTDMALALIEKVFGKETASQVAINAEYEWNRDADHDPFGEIIL
jgi:transcriptional regulator GlxA family with amidase domain